MPSTSEPRVEHRSKYTKHETPESVLSRVRQIDDIYLDPASTKDNPTRAKVWLYPEKHDGLRYSWVHAGLVFVNPPYSREDNRVWPKKIAAEGAEGAEIVALVAARTGSLWWAHMWTAARICFVRGRLRFKKQRSGAPFDSAICYWGPRPDSFERAMQGLGKLVVP